MDENVDANATSYGGASLEQAQRNLVQDAAWASLIGIFSGGVILVGFALLLGAGPLTIGLLGAIPSLGQLAQLPAIILVERQRQRRRLAVWFGVAERVVVLLLGFLAFMADREMALALLIVAQVAIAGLAAMSACAWNSWMHDFLPKQGMGAFFARRLTWSTGFSLAGGLAAGALLDHSPGSPGGTYAVLFAFAGLTGFISSWFLARVPEPLMAAPSAAPPRLATMLGRPFKDGQFRRLIVFLASWSFSTNLAAPFIAVYLLQQVGLEQGLVMVLWASSQIANALAVNAWGRLSDRFSDKSVLRVTTPLFLLCLLALPLASAPERGFLVMPLLVAVHMVLGAATGGTALASGSIALRLAPRSEGTSYLAAIGICNAAAAGVAPILGGLLANWFKDRALVVNIAWTAPGSALEVPALRLHHWEFFFVIAAALGLHALHALTRVPDTSGSSERILVRDLALEAARTLRSLSSAAGLRANAGFPFGRLVGRRPTRLRLPGDPPA